MCDELEDALAVDDWDVDWDEEPEGLEDAVDDSDADCEGDIDDVGEQILFTASS